VIIGVHRVLVRIRHLDFDRVIQQALDDDIARLLTEAATRRPARSARPTTRPVMTLSTAARWTGKRCQHCSRHGLASFADVVIRAKVEISPGRPHPQQTT